MSKKNIAIIMSSITVVTIIGLVAFTSSDIEESLSVDTNVSVDGQQEKEEKDWVQLEKDNLPYTADGDLHVPVKEESAVDFEEDLTGLTVEDLKEVVSQEDTGIVYGVTEGNNIVAIIPEDLVDLYNSEPSGERTEFDDELQALMEAHQAEFAAKYGTMTNEEVYAAQEALNNSSYGSHITMGQSSINN